MTTTLFARSPAAMLLTIFFGLFLAGCATSGAPTVAWNSRVGNFSFDQAKAELGPPNQSRNLPEGGSVVEWVTRRNAGAPTMEPLRAGGVDQPNGLTPSSLPKSEYLVLTFDASGKLVKWQRVIR